MYGALSTRFWGYESFYLVGHDWGGPTAYALAARHPDAVKRLVIVDVSIPGSGADFSQGGRRWHHQFHMTPDLPEALTAGREDVYLSWFYRTFAYRPDAITANDLQEYLRTYTQPGAMRAGFAFYRAIGQDVADNERIIAGFKLPMPVLTVAGGVSYPHGRGRGAEAEESLKCAAVDVRSEIIPACGHFVPEEAPAFSTPGCCPSSGKVDSCIQGLALRSLASRAAIGAAIGWSAFRRPKCFALSSTCVTPYPK